MEGTAGIVDSVDSVNVENTVNIIIRFKGGIVLIRRKDSPSCWELPCGRLNANETLEVAAVRIAQENTGLKIKLLRQLHTYSYPQESKNSCVIATVFIAEGKGEIVPGADAADAGVFDIDSVPKIVPFHKNILMDYQNEDY